MKIPRLNVAGGSVRKLWAMDKVWFAGLCRYLSFLASVVFVLPGTVVGEWGSLRSSAGSLGRFRGAGEIGECRGGHVICGAAAIGSWGRGWVKWREDRTLRLPPRLNLAFFSFSPNSQPLLSVRHLPSPFALLQTSPFSDLAVLLPWVRRLPPEVLVSKTFGGSLRSEAEATTSCQFVGCP